MHTSKSSSPSTGRCLSCTLCAELLGRYQLLRGPRQGSARAATSNWGASTRSATSSVLALPTRGPPGLASASPQRLERPASAHAGPHRHTPVPISEKRAVGTVDRKRTRARALRGRELVRSRCSNDNQRARPQVHVSLFRSDVSPCTYVPTYLPEEEEEVPGRHQLADHLIADIKDRPSDRGST